MTVRETGTNAVEQVKDVVERAQKLRVTRVIQRFSEANGGLLAAGMAYQSLFALFAAVWVGFSIAGIWVRSNNGLYDELIILINQSVPNLVGDNGAIPRSMLDQANTTLTYTGLIALAGLIWTALSWLSSTRTAIRTIFGVGNDQRNFFVQRSIDAVQALAFGVGLIVSALIALLTRQFFELILLNLGVEKSSPISTFALNAVSVLVTMLINFGTMAGMYRVLSHLYIPWRNLLIGAALSAVGLTALSQGSSFLLRGASRNPLLASFAVFVALLLWFNFVCMVILLGASWISVGMEDRGLSARRLSPEEAELERARRTYRAKLESARDAVRAASAEYEESRGWLQRRRNRNALLRALRVLQTVSAQDPDRGDRAK